MAQRHGRQSYFRKLLGSMVLVFFVPALLTVTLFAVWQVNTVKRQLVDAYNENIAHLSYLVDSQLAAGEQLALHLTNDSFFREMNRREYNVLDFGVIPKELLRYTLNGSFVEDILVYMDQKPMSYGISGIYPNYTSPTGVKIDDVFYHEYVLDRSHYFRYRTACISRAGIARKALIYTAESPMQPGLVVTAVLDQHALEDVFKTGLSGSLHEGGWLMFSEDLDAWMAFLPDMADDTAAVRDTALQVMALKPGDTLRLKSGSYLVAKAASPSSGMTYANLVPYGSVVSRLFLTSTLTISAVIGLFALSLVVVSRIARRSYRPVERLYTNVKGPDCKAPKDADELAEIGSAFADLRSVITRYDSNIHSHMPGMRMRMLFKLINGSFETAEDFNYEAAFVHMRFTRRFFFAVLLHCADGVPVPDAGVVPTIESLLPEALEGYGAATLDPNEYVFIFAAEDASYGKEMLYELQGKAAKLLAAPVTMAVSSAVDDVGRIGQAYIQCRSIQGGVTQRGEITFFTQGEDMRQLLSVTDDLAEDFERLRNAIYDGRTRDVSDFLERFVGYIEEKQLSFFTTRCVCYELINTVMRAINDLMNRDESSQIRFPQTTGLASFHTPKELSNVIYELSLLVTSELGKENKQPGPVKVQMEEVLAYIHAHFADYNFSVKQLAEHEGMSLSSFSQFFKANAGMTVIDYTLKCRINRAKELLETTDMLIADIVFAIGYVSVPSFVNKFKKVTGTTPGEYRQQMKDGPHD